MLKLKKPGYTLNENDLHNIHLFEFLEDFIRFFSIYSCIKIQQHPLWPTIPRESWQLSLVHEDGSIRVSSYLAEWCFKNLKKVYLFTSKWFEKIILKDCFLCLGLCLIFNIPLWFHPTSEIVIYKNLNLHFHTSFSISSEMIFDTNISKIFFSILTSGVMIEQI